MHEAVGLRERKKARTRTAISQAVLHLALARGLEAVTVEDIAAAADVSVRTYHNYFGSKEDALVAAWQSEFEVHVETLRSRPRDEPILESLEHMLVGIISSVVRHPDDAVAQTDLVWTSLVMTGQRSMLLDEAIRMVTEVVARRTGTDAATDLYPHLVTAAAISAVVTSIQFAPLTGPAKSDQERVLHECFALLRAGLQRPDVMPT